ncbi:MAG TPA: WD40 repeat domain-containing protein [Micromonosporaceae bacterium]|nr:WD40 repeat domain-containing protein [Micromonosporaceae bacterium]
MSTELDDAVRETLHELAAEVRPANLTAPALRRAGRIRIRRGALTAAAAVVATAAVATPYVLLHDRGTHQVPPPSVNASVPTRSSPPAPPSVQDGPVRLVDGWLLVTGPNGADELWLWDWVRGRFRSLPYNIAIPAPTGDLVMVGTDDNRIGVLDLHTDKVRWLPRRGVDGMVDWAADGRRFVYRAEDDNLVLADAVALTTRNLRWAPGGTVGASSVAFLPGDSEVVIPISNGHQLQAYSVVDGHPTRILPLPVEDPRGHVWSPDGRYLVTRRPDGTLPGSNTVVMEAATGRVVAEFSTDDDRAVFWIDDDRLLSIEHRTVRLLSIDGHTLGTYPWPTEFTDNELHSYWLIKR